MVPAGWQRSLCLFSLSFKRADATTCCRKGAAPALRICLYSQSLFIPPILPFPFPSPPSHLPCPGLHQISYFVFSLEKTFVWHVERLVGRALSRVFVHEEARTGAAALRVRTVIRGRHVAAYSDSTVRLKGITLGLRTVRLLSLLTAFCNHTLQSFLLFF